MNDDYNYESNIVWFDKGMIEIDRIKDFNYVYKIIVDDLNKL